MKIEKTSPEHGDYRGYLYEALTNSKPDWGWFSCPKCGLLRAVRNRWRCPFCNSILTKLTQVEAFQMKHGQNPMEKRRKYKRKRESEREAKP